MRHVLLLATVACAARTPVAPAPSDDLTITPLVDGVWLHTSYRDIPPWGRVLSNGLVVVVGDTSVLVDTGWTDDQTARVLDWAEDTLSRPVTRAVLTHAHDDKMGGVGALHAQGVETWAHPLSNALAPTRHLLPAAHDLPLDADGRSAALAPLEVLFPGGGHTVDNVVVALPSAGVLFGGCLVRPGGATDLGNTADADLDAWADSVARVRASYGTLPIVVPSHGPPAGPELLDATEALATR